MRFFKLIRGEHSKRIFYFVADMARRLVHGIRNSITILVPRSVTPPFLASDPPLDLGRKNAKWSLPFRVLLV